MPQPSPNRNRRFQSTHSLWSATINAYGHKLILRFQSTHSLWSATISRSAIGRFFWFQSTHSLWSATNLKDQNNDYLHVSIHALLVECDYRSFLTYPRTRYVSIHALLVECDGNPRIRRGKRKRFQSTHSLWSATLSAAERSEFRKFQSTHSLWSATVCGHTRYKAALVSIHALLVECD